MTEETPKPTLATTEPHAVPPALPDTGTETATPAWTGSHTATPAEEHPAASGSKALLGLIAILMVILLVGGIITWRQGAASASQIAQLQSQLDAVGKRADALEARPVAPPQDLRPIEQRVATLEQKPAPQAQIDAAGQQQLAALAGRIDAITARQTQLGTQEQTDAVRIEQTDLPKFQKAEQDDVAQLRQTEQADVAKINQQLAGLDTRLTAAAKAGTEISAINERDTRISQLQAAAAALAAGRPLGQIAGAPPALAQFATTPPPTEAALRLSFDAAANQARAVSQPYTAKTPFMTRLWDRLQSGVVVREGDRVIVGDAVSGVVEHAKRQLVAGDLPGAVAALDGLAGPAAEAMAPWRAQAQSLIDARAALISAAHS